jgi:hypothetical protein
MSSIINTSSFHADLIPLVKNWFGKAYATNPTYYDKMLKVEQADPRNYQVDALVQGFGLLQRKDEGSALTFDFAKEGMKPTYQHVTHALGFIITMEMMEDGDAMKNAKVFTEMLKSSAVKTQETIAANLFNNAFSGSYLMTNGDGVCLVSASHPAVASTQSNLITGGSVDISEAALEQIDIDIKNMKNARGLRIGAQPQKLICSVSDAPTAHRILKSDGRVATADNDTNYLRDSGTIKEIIANPYLTDSDAFFVTTDVPQGLKYLERKAAQIDDSNDFDSKNNKFSVIMRLSVGWSDWRGVVGSAGV